MFDFGVLNNPSSPNPLINKEVIEFMYSGNPNILLSQKE